MKLSVEGSSLQLLIRAVLNLLEALGTVWSQNADSREQVLLEQQMLRLIRALTDLHHFRHRIDEQMQRVQGGSLSSASRQETLAMTMDKLGERMQRVLAEMKARVRPVFSDQLEQSFLPLLKLYRREPSPIVHIAVQPVSVQPETEESSDDRSSIPAAVSTLEPTQPQPPVSKPVHKTQANAGQVLLIPKEMVRIRIGGRLYSEVER